MKKPQATGFWDHIYELRKRLFIAVISTGLFSVTGYVIYPKILGIITDTIGEDLYVMMITEAFMLRLRSAFITGIILSVPVIVYELIMFVFPALKPKEKIYIVAATLSAFFLFIAGLAFSYRIVLPVSINFLKSDVFFPEKIGRLISFDGYLRFFFQFLLAFGLCFQFPIVLLALLKLNIIKLSHMTKNFKYAIIIIFVIAAILTPPDVVSQIMLGLPLIALYAATMLTARIFKIGA